MHLAEGTLPPLHAAIGWAVAIPLVAWSLADLRPGTAEVDQDRPESRRALLPAATSLLFAATLLPLPVPVVGATSHLCLTPLLGLLLGARAVIWPTFFVLLVQALFFAHGGLTTLGANTVSLGVIGPVAAIGVFRLLHGLKIRPALALASACVVGDLAVYLGDAVILAIALSEAAPPLVTFGAVAVGFAPVQVPLAVLEGWLGVTLVRRLSRRRPAAVPEPMRFDADGPLRLRATGALVAFLSVGVLVGCEATGIDDSVFGTIAERGGRAPTDILLDLSGGEFGLAMSVLLPFVFGFVVGRTWERLGQRDHGTPH
jgi:cobalt/nickel transport system permease protein